VISAAVGKADAAASLMARQSAADVNGEKVAAQPTTQLAASYNIGLSVNSLLSIYQHQNS